MSHITKKISRSMKAPKEPKTYNHFFVNEADYPFTSMSSITG